MIDSNGDVFVDDFIVGRTGYGCVKFYGKTNVAGLNLDEIGKNLYFSYSCWNMVGLFRAAQIQSFPRFPV